MSRAANRHSSSRSILSASGSSTATASVLWTSFNIGVSLPASVLPADSWIGLNLEGTSRPSGDRGSTTSGYNSLGRADLGAGLVVVEVLFGPDLESLACRGVRDQ